MRAERHCPVGASILRRSAQKASARASDFACSTTSEWSRYLSQPRHTLASARRDIDDGDFAWACFKSQQAAEMAANGLIRACGGLAMGHSVVSPLQAAVKMVPEGIAHCARELDKVCIPTRYPDVYAAGSPHEYFDHRDASAHVACAAAVIAHLEAEAADESAGD